MGKRIFSTVVLWLFLFAVLWEFRTTGAIVITGLIAALTLRELYILLDATGAQTFKGLGIIFGTAIAIEPWLEVRFGLPGHGLLALGTVIFAVRILGERAPDKRLESLKSTVFGLLYVGYLLQYMVRIIAPQSADAAIGLTPDGRLVLALWVVATAKFCDVGALLTGLAIGRHKMAPTISPKKTWEGFVGGMLTSVGIGALVAWLARGLFPPGMDPLHAALKAIPVAAAGIASDLVESVIKRKADIKDSGVAIPGIGGIFDLSDSLLLASPIAYFVIGLH